jgi:hypothetical protein
MWELACITNYQIILKTGKESVFKVGVEVLAVTAYILLS